jgi:hypothetical protein
MTASSARAVVCNDNTRHHRTPNAASGCVFLSVNDAGTETFANNNAG